jgi:hypothetical protein
MTVPEPLLATYPTGGPADGRGARTPPIVLARCPRLRLPLADGVSQMSHPLPRLRADLLQNHTARVHALEQPDS